MKKDWTPEQTEKRRLILDAARELFSKEGVSNVSMRRIAAKVNYSPALIYRYVKNKEELLDQLRSEGYQILLNRMARLDVDPDPIKHLTDLAVEYGGFGVDYWEYYDLMFHMPIQISDDGTVPVKGYEAVLGMVRNAVERAIDAGHFAGVLLTMLCSCHGHKSTVYSAFIFQVEHHFILVKNEQKRCFRKFRDTSYAL